MLLMVEKGIRWGCFHDIYKIWLREKALYGKRDGGKEKSVTKYVIHHLLNFMKSLD